MGKILELVKSDPLLSDWEMFWSVYPRRKAKLDAMKAWKQTEEVRPPIEQVLAAIEEMIEEHDFRADPNGTYFPYPATWLRRGQFLDE